MIDPRLTLLILGAALLLAGCGGSSVSPTPDNPNVSGDLTQEIVSADNTLTFNVPSDWSFQSNFPSTLVLTNDATLLSPDNTAINPGAGQIFVVLSVFPRASTDLATGVSLAEIGGKMVGIITGGGIDSLGAPTEFEINGNKALSYAGVATVEGIQSGVYLLFVDMIAQDTFVNVSVSTAAGEQNNYADLIQRIVQTISIDRSAAAEG